MPGKCMNQTEQGGKNMVQYKVKDCTKNSRFTCFVEISKLDIKIIKGWLKRVGSGETDRQSDFLYRVREAVRKIDYNFRIATREPCVKDGRIFYPEGEEINTYFTAKQWELMAIAFAPERGSRLANIHELFLWYALRIADGFWTLEYVADDSSGAGNYIDSPEALGKRARTGEVASGGYKDGQGNTRKLVTVEDGYAIVGGECQESGKRFPVACEIYLGLPNMMGDYATGVVVLTK